MITLDTITDLVWLEEVHGIPIDNVEVALLYGNEDYPEQVETYSVNDIRTTPNVYLPDPTGNLVLVTGQPN